MTTLITKADLQPIIDSCRGDDFFSDAVKAVKDEKALINLLCRYVQFNSIFGAGVANLAGEISSRQDIFQDREEQLRCLADRSVEIGAEVFAAAIDEFGDRSFVSRHSHRTLAQATIKGIGAYYGYSDEQMNGFIVINTAVTNAIEKVRAGYKLNCQVSEIDLFQALGFHIGSEILADREFNFLDQNLRTNQAELVKYLKNKKVTINQIEQDAYHWIFIHTSVESDHFDYAVKAANSALNYYCGELSPAAAKQAVIDGFKLFAAVQEEFMRDLSKD